MRVSFATSSARSRLARPGILVVAALLSSVIALADDPLPSITVSGEGVMDVPPDAFVLNVSISVRDGDVDRAQAQAIERSRKVIEAGEKFAIDRARTYTSNLSLRPIYENEQSRVFSVISPQPLGYEVTQNLRFTVADVSQSEPFTTALIKAGVTTVHSLEFVSVKTPDLWQPARERAAKDARSRAEGIAAALGQTVGAPLAIRVLDYNESLALGCRWDNVQVGAGGLTSSDGARVIPPSNIKVQARVEVRFVLAPGC